MKRGIYILVIIALLIGLTSAFGCSESGEQSSIPVIKQGGKELTILRSTMTASDRYYWYAVAEVQNTGSEPIKYAELEMEFYKVTAEPGAHTLRYVRFIIKGLDPGEVQTLYARFFTEGIPEELIPKMASNTIQAGSFKIKVNKLE